MNFFRNRSLNTQFAIIFIMLAASWVYGFSIVMKNLIEMQLTTQAKTVVNNVQSLGQMLAGHGGMWVKAGPDYPFSNLGRVDIGNGDFFYWKNPALVQREFSDAVLKNSYPASFRMTSLSPMNANNQPDAFELKALTKMKDSTRARIKVEPEINHNNGLFEYVEPVFHSQSCISCHGSAALAPEAVRKNYGTINGFNFKEGDLAGGISVKISYDSSEMLKGIINWKVIVFVIIPALIFFIVIFLNTKKIADLAARIASYSSGHSIGIDIKDIPEDSSNEVSRLIKSVSNMAGTVEGTHAQVLSMQQKYSKLYKAYEEARIRLGVPIKTTKKSEG